MAGVHRSVDMGFIPSIHRSGATRNAPDQAISVVSPERTDHRPTTEETTMKLQTRIAAGVVGIAAAAGIGLGAAGAAHAGTMPITRPGEPTVAMTITNHTDKPEYLIGSTAGQSGQWVNAPQRVLYPGASETVTAVAPFSNYLTANAQYRIGHFGPTANYEIEDMKGNVNTAMSGIWGPHAQQYWMSHSISSRYPNVNVGFDQW
ncbi:hypothetical protein Gbro_0115 [Gordonia bronchialis DSM 43247]|uniref:Uncharacterized protein n=2 Tax=Gordonia bronchialis TaxID=2054 RepID=D0LB34_GORB4|nr:hypothetical protein Gbro_0115 [Gordonia bronchialis DSM 43247]STQ62222.1 Uncharacterised protein [Gordonia bronchialis]